MPGVGAAGRNADAWVSKEFVDDQHEVLAAVVCYRDPHLMPWQAVSA
ncbi:MAG: hypothetical protein AB1925_15705 [Actinomycetota bacterium]